MMEMMMMEMMMTVTTMTTTMMMMMTRMMIRYNYDSSGGIMTRECNEIAESFGASLSLLACFQ